MFLYVNFHIRFLVFCATFFVFLPISFELRWINFCMYVWQYDEVKCSLSRSRFFLVSSLALPKKEMLLGRQPLYCLLTGWRLVVAIIDSYVRRWPRFRATSWWLRIWEHDFIPLCLVITIPVEVFAFYFHALYFLTQMTTGLKQDKREVRRKIYWIGWGNTICTATVIDFSSRQAIWWVIVTIW